MKIVGTHPTGAQRLRGAGRPLRARRPGGISLGAGTHVVENAVGHVPTCSSEPQTCTGWNLDQLTLDSAAGGVTGSGGFPTAQAPRCCPATQPGSAPTVTQTSSHIDTQTATVTGATQPFEFVLGESVNKGWKAVAQPAAGAPAGSHAVDLGRSQLTDGFANGWQVTQADLHAFGGPSFRHPDLDAAESGVGRSRIVHRHVGAVPPAGVLAERGRGGGLLALASPRRLRGAAGTDSPQVAGQRHFDSPTLTIPFLREVPQCTLSARPLSHFALARHRRGQRPG